MITGLGLLLMLYGLYGLLSPVWAIAAERWGLMVFLIVSGGMASWAGACLVGGS